MGIWNKVKSLWSKQDSTPAAPKVKAPRKSTQRKAKKTNAPVSRKNKRKPKRGG